MPSDIAATGDTMKQNVHNIERIVRIIVGLAIISLVFIGSIGNWSHRVVPTIRAIRV
jgi:hypothetical protein